MVRHGSNPLGHHMVLPYIILALLGCGPNSQERAAIAYATDMQALLDENKAIGREFLDVAASIKKDSLDTHGVAKRFTERIVPRAVDLSRKVEEIEPGTESLAKVHGEIARAWQIRADAYRQLRIAWNDGDLQGYTRALHDHRAVEKAETRYLNATNTILAPYRLSLDPYP